MAKHYLLYTDKNKTSLLASASSLKDRKEITEEYTSGQWFSYDWYPENNFMDENTEKLVRCKFPKVAIKRDYKGNIIG